MKTPSADDYPGITVLGSGRQLPGYIEHGYLWCWFTEDKRWRFMGSWWHFNDNKGYV